MANYSTLKTAVADVVKTNGTQAITGANLQSVLLSIINSVGGGGYIFKGVATPSTSAGTPDQNVFYIGGAGTYANFGSSYTVPVGSIGVFKYDGSWTKEQIKMFDGIDESPALGSTNLITSNPVAVIQQKITGLIGINYYQGNIIGNTGKASIGNASRVTNAQPILATPSIHVVCTGDVRGNTVQLYKQGYDIETGGVNGTDWYGYSLPSSSSRTDFTVEIDPAFPNIYITFCRASDSSSAITPSEVAANVKIYDTSSVSETLKQNGSFQGIAIPSTVPNTINDEVYYLAKQSGTYTNFGGIVVNNGEYCLLKYNNSTWSKVFITKEGMAVLGKDDAIRTEIGFIDYTTGALTERKDSFFVKVYDAEGIKSIKAYVGANSTTNAQIAFYSTNEISTASYLGAYSVQSVADANGSGRWYYTDNIPSYAAIAVVYDRFLNIAESAAVVEVSYNYAEKYVKELLSDVSELNETVYGKHLDNLYLVQGNYASGVPAPSALDRVRINRMIAKSEAPFRVVVPETDNGRFYMLLFYSTLDDYTSYTHFESYYATNPQGMLITQEMFGSSAGITMTFCAKNNLTDQITPADFKGTKLITEYGLVDDVEALKQAIPGVDGNSEYYGRTQTLKITDEVHKCNSRLVCEHFYDEYPYTRRNQSMAIWDGKAFCFNDTNHADTDGFCVVIDVETGSVITRVTDIPSVVASPYESHLNAAQFTDVYYQYGDKYPLLLLSRGDYASAYADRLCMYVFRITEPTTNNFVFTRIKTIYTPNNPLAICNPSWEYDKFRRMIWGHLNSQDWRWGNSSYRKFDNTSLPFVAPTGTEYICITSGGAMAATSATITITLGNVQTTVSVSAGGTLEKVLPFVPYESGCSYICVNQSAQAFTGQYVVFACDANGNNRKELKFECAIQGFVSPDLTDPADYTVPLSEYTIPVYIDKCVFQGGSFANGKLFLPIEQYTTINKQPTDYTGNCCIVVEPTTGYIESIIKTDALENEGCAIWNGKLYVSSHVGGATGHKIGFRLMEYSFD